MSAVSARILTFVFCLMNSVPLIGFSNLTNNDPYPIYTALYPWTYLTNSRRDCLIDSESHTKKEYFDLSISPFRQSAVIGRNIDKALTNLGNLKGNWNMIALFYPGMNADGTVNTSTAAQTALANALGLPATPCAGTLYDPSNTDSKKEFGFFTIPLKYRKYGVRFEADFQFFYDVGLKIQTGVADLIQTATFEDLTCQAVGQQCPIKISEVPEPCQTNCCNVDGQITCDCKTLVIHKIMRQKDIIAKTLGYSTKNFNHRGMEDTRLSLYWRHVFPINQDRPEYPYVLIMPFCSLEALFATGNEVNPNCLFAAPNGNNGHSGFGFNAGLNFDFVETIEVGFEASMTAWESRSYLNMPVPTNELQAGMFPYKANLCICPGTNWSFSAIMNARHFLYQLSLWAQWVVVAHGRDKYSNVSVIPFNAGDVPPVALTGKMSDESRWHSHAINVGATYDISPNIALGFLWQAPVSRRNAYRSTTIMGSVIVTW